jgi:hypothetical protein
MNQKKIYILGLSTLAILVVGAYALYSHSNLKLADKPSTEQSVAMAQITALKCPEAYTTEDEKMQAYLAFGENLVKANPKAKGDIVAYDTARTDFLIERHCTATLTNFGYDGISPINAQTRQEIIVAMVKNDQ